MLLRPRDNSDRNDAVTRQVRRVQRVVVRINLNQPGLAALVHEELADVSHDRPDSVEVDLDLQAYARLVPFARSTVSPWADPTAYRVRNSTLPTRNRVGAALMQPWRDPGSSDAQTRNAARTMQRQDSPGQANGSPLP